MTSKFSTNVELLLTASFLSCDKHGEPTIEKRSQYFLLTVPMRIRGPIMYPLASISPTPPNPGRQL